MRKCELLIATAAMVLVAAFWIARTVDYEFLPVDDTSYVVYNNTVKAGLTAEGLRWALGNVRVGNNWHPATWVSLMADAELSDGGLESMSAVMHRHNAILHGFCTALLFLLMLQLLGARSGWRDAAIPLLLAVCWGLHPLRAECVCWVTERKELLCTAYALATLILWRMRRVWTTALAVVTYALALLSKSVAVTVPAILIAFDLMHETDPWRCVRRRWWLWASLFLLAGGASVFTLIAQAPMVTPNQRESTFAVKVANAFGAYAIHLSRVIAPVGLSFSRLYVNQIIWSAFLPGLVLVGLMFCSTWRYLFRGQRSTAPAAGFLAAAWIGAGLLPMCGLLRVGVEFNPDRYGHWVGAGLAVVLALLCGKLTGRIRGLVAAAILAATSAFTISSWNYAATFRTGFKMFQNTLARNPGHAEALFALATDYELKFHDRDKAIELSEQSFAALCADETAVQLVTLRSLRGNPEDCARVKEICSFINDDHSLDENGGALTALGVVAMIERRWDDAISCLTDANERRARLNIPSDDNLLRIAMCKYNKGDRKGAESAFRFLLKTCDNEAIRNKCREFLK